LHGLRDKHRLGWDYFDALVYLAQANAKLTKQESAYGMRYVVASLWVFADNARPMAIEQLKLTGDSQCCCVLLLCC
jgi:hypothetical protein